MATVSQTATTLASPVYTWEDGLPAETQVRSPCHILPTESAHRFSSRECRTDPLRPRQATTGERLRANNEGVYSSSRSLHNGNLNPDHLFDRYVNGEHASDTNGTGLETDPFSQHKYRDPKPRSVKDRTSAVEGTLELHGDIEDGAEDAQQRRGANGLYADSDDDENSKWIHRDKLARIENEELQAAGIILPRQRDRARSKSQNRPRRDQSQDKVNGSGRSVGGVDQTVTRPRKNSGAASSETKTLDHASIPSWDLRRPEEILGEADSHRVSHSSGKGSSRIPVPKASHAPIANDSPGRDGRAARKRDGSPGEEDSITHPKTRSRSGSAANTLTKASNAGTGSQPNKRGDGPAKKTTTTAAARKPKTANGTAGRPKTRGGPSKDSTTRPSTRSGEREFSSCNSKPMEGEPPWMVSAYRPDPRLPPDQQLLPTVAKRLQQEKWEREGKFGNIYDKEFRPLTDAGFGKPPQPSNTARANEAEENKEKEREKAGEDEGKGEGEGGGGGDGGGDGGGGGGGGGEGGGGEWPLKDEPKSPKLPARTNSYSTMPKIADNPAMSPLASPKTNSEQQPAQTVKVPEPPEDSAAEKKGGCGCCIVM